MKDWYKFREWLLGRPIWVAVFIFLAFVLSFSLLRLIFHTDHFLAELWSELEYGIGMGIFGAIVGYLLARARKGRFRRG